MVLAGTATQQVGAVRTSGGVQRVGRSRRQARVLHRAGRAGEAIIARTAEEPVVARVDADRRRLVGKGPRGNSGAELIAVVSADLDVVALAPGEHVGPGSAIEPVVAGDAEQPVGPLPADQQIATATADQRVLSRSTEQLVAGRAAVEQVVPAAALVTVARAARSAGGVALDAGAIQSTLADGPPSRSAPGPPTSRLEPVPPTTRSLPAPAHTTDSQVPLNASRSSPGPRNADNVSSPAASQTTCRRLPTWPQRSVSWRGCRSPPCR